MKKNRYLVCNEDLKGRWEIRVRESNCLLFLDKFNGKTIFLITANG